MSPAAAGIEIDYRLIYSKTGATVLDPDGYEIEGRLSELFNIKLRHPLNGSVMTLIDRNGLEKRNYITWTDSNQDAKLTSGDTITLIGASNTTFGDNDDVEPGIATDRMSFVLKDNVINKIITTCPLENNT